MEELTKIPTMQQYIDHSYIDYSLVSDEELRLLDEDASLLPPPPCSKIALAREKLSGMRCTYGPMKLHSGGVVQPFPGKLLDLLDRSEFSEFIDWMPHGRAFLVKNPKLFASHVLPRYFKQSKFLSFTRQLNLWSFKRISRGADAGAYYHPLFLRGRPYLAMRMKRQKIKGTGMKLIPNPDAEPDFYNHWPRIPKLEACLSSTRRESALFSIPQPSETSTTTPTTTKTKTTPLSVERSESQHSITTSRPIIHDSLNNSGNGNGSGSGSGNEMLSLLLQEHFQLQLRLQQQQQLHLQQKLLQHHAAAIVGGRGGAIDLIGNQDSNGENGREVVDVSSTVPTANVWEGRGLSASQKDMRHSFCTEITNHSPPQRKLMFPPIMRPMAYDNFLHPTSATNHDRMSLFDDASRYCYLEQHHSALGSAAPPPRVGSTNAGGWMVETAGVRGIAPTSPMINHEFTTTTQGMNNYHQAMTTLGSSTGMYPPLHQRLSTSDRILMMERMRVIDRIQQQAVVHGDKPVNGLSGHAQWRDDLTSLTQNVPQILHADGGADGVVYPTNALCLPTDIKQSHPYSPPALRSTTPSVVGEDDRSKMQDQSVTARFQDEDTASSSHETTHLEAIALAQQSKFRSLVLADALLRSQSNTSTTDANNSHVDDNNNRTNGEERGKSHSSTEATTFATEMIQKQTEGEEEQKETSSVVPPLPAATVTADPLQKHRTSLGRPFGRKTS